MKKTVLVCMKNMQKAGTEVACLNLLKSIDLKKFDVTLLLFEKTGELLSQIPAGIKVEEIRFNHERLCREIHNGFYENRPIHGLDAVIADYYIRILDKFNPDHNHRYDFMLNHLKWQKTDYDYILDFQGYGYFMTAFVSRYGFTGKKVTWIHDENVDWSGYVRSYLDGFDYFCGVSKACIKSFKDRWGKFSEKLCVFYNILDTKDIIERAREAISEEGFSDSVPVFVTIGRLEDQKGYPNAIDAARQLKDAGIFFKWYCIGRGSKEAELKQYAIDRGVCQEIEFIGPKSNPYPYIKNCTVYVQPSEHEGYGIAIAEARVLKKCIVATDLECVKEQISDGENGYLIPYDADALAEKLKELLDHPEQRAKVEQKLEQDLALIGDKPVYFRYKEGE